MKCKIAHFSADVHFPTLIGCTLFLHASLPSLPWSPSPVCECHLVYPFSVHLVQLHPLFRHHLVAHRPAGPVRPTFINQRHFRRHLAYTVSGKLCCPDCFQLHPCFLCATFTLNCRGGLPLADCIHAKVTFLVIVQCATSPALLTCSRLPGFLQSIFPTTPVVRNPLLSRFFLGSPRCSLGCHPLPADTCVTNHTHTLRPLLILDQLFLDVIFIFPRSRRLQFFVGHTGNGGSLSPARFPL